MAEENFKWDDESTVIRRVNAIAVYGNPRNDVVIRQESRIGDEDSVIIVPLQQMEKLIEELQRVTMELRDLESEG